MLVKQQHIDSELRNNYQLCKAAQGCITALHDQHRSSGSYLHVNVSVEERKQTHNSRWAWLVAILY